MKYIKLYEAFESDKLSKTLKFISKDKDSRQSFRSKLSEIASQLDFPMSKFSDDMFTYLPFKKALNLNIESIDKKCKFESPTIKGEYCNKGRIKRTWGDSTRIVECPSCKGSGKDISYKPEIKYIKFWFTKDGKFVTITGCDGVRRSSSSASTSRMGGYKRGGVVLPDKIKSLPNGTALIASVDSGIPTLCYAWTTNSGYSSSTTYLIQDHHDGSSPSDTGWRRYGRYTWALNSEGYGASNINFAVLEEEEEEKPIDPYEYNTVLDTYRFRFNDGISSKDRLSDAHFALILDYSKLSKSDFIPIEKTRKTRKDQRDGAYSLKSDDDIKKQNINKYMLEMSKNVKISDDMSDIKNQTMRVLGWNFAGFNILMGRGIDNLSYLINYIHASLNTTDVDYKISYLNNAISTISTAIKNNTEYNIRNRNILSRLSKDLESKPQYCKDVYDKIMKLNSDIIKKINEYKVENIQDMELLRVKISSIRSMYSNSDRFSPADDIYYFMNKLISGYQPTIFDGMDENESKKIIKKIDTFTYMIDRV